MTPEEIAQLLAELRGIRVAVEQLVVAFNAGSDALTTCPHPFDTRIDFGMTDGVADWTCGQCGYRTTPARA